MKTRTKDDILGPSFYPHECGGMIECVTKQDALKAMEEYATQSSDAGGFFKGQTPADFKNYIDRISMLSWDCDLNEALEEFSIFLKEKGAKG